MWPPTPAQVSLSFETPRELPPLKQAVLSLFFPHFLYQFPSGRLDNVRNGLIDDRLILCTITHTPGNWFFLLKCKQSVAPWVEFVFILRPLPKILNYPELVPYQPTTTLPRWASMIFRLVLDYRNTWAIRQAGMREHDVRLLHTLASQVPTVGHTLVLGQVTCLSNSVLMMSHYILTRSCFLFPFKLFIALTSFISTHQLV